MALAYARSDSRVNEPLSCIYTDAKTSPILRFDSKFGIVVVLNVRNFTFETDLIKIGNPQIFFSMLCGRFQHISFSS